MDSLEMYVFFPWNKLTGKGKDKLAREIGSQVTIRMKVNEL